MIKAAVPMANPKTVMPEIMLIALVDRLAKR